MKATINNVQTYRTAIEATGHVNGKRFKVYVGYAGMGSRKFYAMVDENGNHGEGFTAGHAYQGFTGEETKAIKTACREAHANAYGY